MAGRRTIKVSAGDRKEEMEDGKKSPISYFAGGATGKDIDFISSGCCLFDCALGGGYAGGRVVNIVGDRSSGKTLLAIEAATNFLSTNPKGWVRYFEAEAAFDQDYAAALGTPVDRIIFNAEGAMIETVEQVYDESVELLDRFKNQPGLIIIDSLDALSDAAEMGRDFDEGTYGGTKPKQIGKYFRMLVRRFEMQNVAVIVISQIRDKLNVSFGETKTRSGGRALDFYATHIVWLAEIEKMKRTIGGVERVTGIKVEAYVKKNKVGPAFRKVRYPLLFGYGVDDVMAAADWLVEIGRDRRLHELGMKKGAARAKTKEAAAKATPEDSATANLKDYKATIEKMRDEGGAAFRELRQKVNAIILDEWARVEATFLPRTSKY